jgi:hypothetical protein
LIRYAWGGHFVTHIGLRADLPSVGTKLVCDHREHHAKLGKSHEVTAARAGRPSGRTKVLEVIPQ